MTESVYNYEKKTGKITTAVYTSDKTVDNLINGKRPKNKLFFSKSVNSLIDTVKEKAKDKELAKLFENCFPNTLDTTTYYSKKNGKPDTYIITGDIDAMWLRDSTAQVSPYIPLINDDIMLKNMIEGVINRQSDYIRIDPYANSFNKDLGKSPWMTDFTDMKAELHERKWEIDSLCNHVRLSYNYYNKAREATVFTAS